MAHVRNYRLNRVSRRDRFNDQELFSDELKDGLRLLFLFFGAMFLRPLRLLLDDKSEPDGGRESVVGSRFIRDSSTSYFKTLTHTKQ